MPISRLDRLQQLRDCLALVAARSKAGFKLKCHSAILAQDRQQRRELALMVRRLNDYAFTQIGFQKSEKSRKILLLLNLCPLNLKLRSSYRSATFCLWIWSVT